MPDAAGTLFDSLLAIMSRLRGDGGCPWDRDQTRESLKPYLIEEAYEVLEAIDDSDTEHLVEELGDLLFQVVFHCQIAGERSEFTMADVLQRLCDKMVRRHPHVFGDRPVASAREALSQWERIKSEEAPAGEKLRSALDGVPSTLPALLRAQRLQVKAARLGFDWPTWQGAWAKVREEMAEMEDALGAGDATRIREELGDLLFSVVNAARLLDIDAEDTLRHAATKFTRRFREVEAGMVAAGTTVRQASAEELDRAWAVAKAQEPGRADASRTPP
jgi:MazG family protein